MDADASRECAEDTTNQDCERWHAEDRPDCTNWKEGHRAGSSWVLGLAGIGCPFCGWWASIDDPELERLAKVEQRRRHARWS